MLSVQAALRLILDTAHLLEPQSTPLDEALGQVCAEPLMADRPLPPFDRVTMDGFALKATDLTQPGALRLDGTLAAGDEPTLKLKAGGCIQVMTGAVLPQGADAVIEVESTTTKGTQIQFNRPAVAKENIVPTGSEAQPGEVFFPPGQPVTPSLIAFLASIGKTDLPVYRQPKIAVIATGSELVPAQNSPLYFQIRNCNSPALMAQIKTLGINGIDLGIAVDTEAAISKKIEQGLAQADILILSGGVSMGEWDFVPKVLQSHGIQKVFHKLKLKPGKPVWFGTSPNKWVFGLPGNPVSVQVCFKLFVESLIRAMTGHKQTSPLCLPLKQDLKKRTDRETYIPAKLVTEQGATWVEEIKIGGSGDFSSLAHSQGIFRFDLDLFELKKGETVSFYPWRALL